MMEANTITTELVEYNGAKHAIVYRVKRWMGCDSNVPQEAFFFEELDAARYMDEHAGTKWRLAKDTIFVRA
jgi:hypothetical protein